MTMTRRDHYICAALTGVLSDGWTSEAPERAIRAAGAALDDWRKP